MTRWGRVRAAVTWVQARKPVRVVMHYLDRRGPLLANGLSYQAIFAVFAAIWVGFAIAGSVLRGRPELLAALLGLIATNAPGLIDLGEGGAIDPAQLLTASILDWTGIIAGVLLAITALGWFDAGRAAVRAMADLAPGGRSILILKAQDLLLVVGLGLGLLLSAAISVVATVAFTELLSLIGVTDASPWATLASRAIVLLIALALNTGLLAAFYRISLGRLPGRRLLPGTLLASIALGALQTAGGALLGGAGTNPLLAGFAVIVGLLLWFNLVCQVIVVGAAWIAVDAADHGIALGGSSATAPTAAGGPGAAGGGSVPASDTVGGAR